MFGVRFLSLMALVAALFLARIALSADLPTCDRVELPSDGGNDGGSVDDDGADLALPPGTTLSSALPAQPLVVVPEHAPATSPFAASIFRPPTSALA